MSQKNLADVGAVLTGSGALVTWAAVETALRIGAAAVTIAVGVLTGMYYFEAWREKRRNRSKCV